MLDRKAIREADWQCSIVTEKHVTSLLWVQIRGHRVGVGVIALACRAQQLVYRLWPYTLSGDSSSGMYRSTARRRSCS